MFERPKCPQSVLNSNERHKCLDVLYSGRNCRIVMDVPEESDMFGI